MNYDEISQDWLNSLVDDAPESWDYDTGIEEIISLWVNYLVSEVKRLGGCLHPYCHHEDNEVCDHGYLKTATAPRLKLGDKEDLLKLERELAPAQLEKEAS